MTRGYYYWRSDTYLASTETSYLRQQGIQKLYAKCLDIDWNIASHAFPLTITPVHETAFNLRRNDSLTLVVVPVVFITNKTFQQIDSSEIPLLATRILRKCIPGFDTMAIPLVYPFGDAPYPIPVELQFDCDWSGSTKNKYFYFLQQVRQQLGNRAIALSATVRLHQYKYPGKTGVPPVNRGMLMVYNVEKLTDHQATNSIFDYEQAKKYFTGSGAYPLPLDIALPAYSWGIVFRQGKFYQIENRLQADTLRKSSFLRYAPPIPGRLLLIRFFMSCFSGQGMR
ncbi:hypothetical protein [Paraflavitalea speifideaquila]|uniref:hypothetical protein n=1 Tax=Paraflavitalea speifideaquila TaxID=3076558 RepID=UPI0028E7D069|nr:hypothetical protein [Paraflavitalea speifideiaquila]